MKNYKVKMDIWLEWKCTICDKREPMKTQDGDEDWLLCCGKPMRIQPMRKLYAEEMKPPL